MVMEDVTNVNRNRRYISDGLAVVKMTFLKNMQEISTAPRYEPEMVYQHFGDEETIFGYEDLEVTIHHTAQTLYSYINVSYSSKAKNENGLEADDVIDKLVHPDVRPNVLVSGKEEFQQKLIKQKDFKPFGEMVHKFELKGKSYEVYKVAEQTEEFNLFLERIQTLGMFFIECCSLTDNTEDNWLHYFIYERCDTGEGDGSTVANVAGYATLFKFYNYIDRIRPRIAQMLLLPQYRKSGIGASFMESFLRDLRASPEVFDVTVESPGDQFVSLRDYVDCVNCMTLREFAPENLKRGYSDKMRQAALEKLKISRQQARRVYEILRYRATNKKDKEELKAQRIDVKRRLYAPMKKSDQDWKRLNLALTPDELRQAACGQMDEETKFSTLSQNYDRLMEAYQKTIDRIEQHPSIF
ncbi:Histone acetyltransferase type B catalytic subunit [Caenorhabditis elegans]|uniref:Histone acetyltransferase type B catalytic subunit n=1 Tax=Caenorhabditis elegans TaxID=6239 RepID=Q21484_CAEEL|nr:Histone acetyltransferase type B catalytic subunit [Caenorhabditis elegans]CAA88954.2 Histone acetyltransferase type B catalytic subunit [Caenorhabditis elegans]|eukprot:NP_499296.2 Histone AcetylTransferase [Caenorhabditis elegans]